MKLFGGLLSLFFIGIIFETDICKGRTPSVRIRKNAQSQNDVNAAGLMYNIVRESEGGGGQDFVFSPLGISRVLGLLMFAVGPQSAKEIESILHPEGEKQTGLPPRHPILPMQGNTFKEATMAVVRPDIHIGREFIQSAHDMDAFVFRTHFSPQDMHKLKETIEMNTELGAVTEFRGFLGLSIASRIVFLNYLKFEALFEHPFRPDGVGKNRMKIDKIPALYAHVPGLHAEVIGLPFKQSNALLLILKPAGKLSLLEAALGRVDVRKLRRKMDFRVMDISMLPMDLFNTIDLRRPLTRAGIKTVFNSSFADLDAFQTEHPLDNIRVYTSVSIDYEGIRCTCNHSAYTPSEETAGAENPEVFLGDEVPFKFSIDKPYVFAVVDSRHVYLMGRKTAGGIHVRV